MKKLSKDLVQQDIKEFQEKLEKIHPNPYRYISRNDFKNLLYKNIEDIDTMKELGLNIMSVLAKLNDGHTYLVPSIDVLGRETFIFDFRYFSNGYYLVSSSKDLEKYLGYRLMGINGFTTQKLEKIVAKFIPQENEISTIYYFSSIIREPFLLEYLGVRRGKCITLDIARGKENVFVKVSPRNYTCKKVFLRDMVKDGDITLQERESYWFTSFEDWKAFYFQYNDCAEIEDLKILDIVREIRDGCFENIVIDLRNNRGGDSDVLKPLVRFLKNASGVHRLFILVGSNTYSSGMINLLQLSSIKNSVSVGEIPHGNPTHYGEVTSFVLPNSKLRVYTSSKIFRFKGYRLGDSFKPTYLVNTGIDDMLNGEDVQMNFVQDMISKRI